MLGITTLAAVVAGANAQSIRSGQGDFVSDTPSPATPAQLKDQLHPRALDLIKLLRPAALLPVCAFGASSVSCPSR